MGFCAFGAIENAQTPDPTRWAGLLNTGTVCAKKRPLPRPPNAARDERERASQSAVATKPTSLARSAFNVAAPLCWGVLAATPPHLSIFQLLGCTRHLFTAENSHDSPIIFRFAKKHSELNKR